jgi:hypothetical protein
MKHSLLLTGVLSFGLVAGCSAQAPTAQKVDVQKTAAEIRTEATRTNNDPIGNPLPLLSSWNTGDYLYVHPYHKVRGLDPAYQLSEIEEGHHILPTFNFPTWNGGEEAIEKFRAYYEAPLQRSAELKLPFTLMGTQWESLLTTDKQYFDLPAEKNPNLVTPDGKVEKKLSPFGPVELWREVGAKWGSSPLMKQLQQWYPNPPLVILLSNNEHPKLHWEEVETDARYLEKYGKGRDDAFKKKVVADGWIERYRALQDGMRSALDKSWPDKVRFVAYGDVGPTYYARWGGWQSGLLNTDGLISPMPRMWDGVTGSYYTDDWNQSTDFRVMSPQVEAMNLIFMKRNALRANPNLWIGFSIWDGQDLNSKRREQYKPKPEYYRSLGQEYSPARYGGYAQFGLWLLRPRAIREYRGWTSDLPSMEPLYLALAQGVDRVYQNATLQAFWRKGELVPNHAQQHPYQNKVLEEYKNEDRWFLLDTNLDAPRPWKLDTEIPVFSLALVEGAKGNRRWLVYAHSPVQERKDVEITVPDYGKVTVDVPVAGAFYVVNEKARSITPVQ